MEAAGASRSQSFVFCSGDAATAVRFRFRHGKGLRVWGLGFGALGFGEFWVLLRLVGGPLDGFGCSGPSGFDFRTFYGSAILRFLVMQSAPTGWCVRVQGLGLGSGLAHDTLTESHSFRSMGLPGFDTGRNLLHPRNRNDCMRR